MVVIACCMNYTVICGLLNVLLFGGLVSVLFLVYAYNVDLGLSLGGRLCNLMCFLVL